MKIKLQIGVFFLFLALIAKHVGFNTTPNQQIVVKFSNAEITDVAKTIEKVKLQLQKIGATDIHTKATASGHLKITYYSASSINEIQQLFSKQTQLKLVYEIDNESSSNIPKTSKDYELNISQIQEYSDQKGDFNGVAITESQQKSDRFQDHKIYSHACIDAKHNLKYLHKKERLKDYKTIILIYHRSYSIPEGRAGPLA